MQHLSWTCSLPNSAGGAVTGTQGGNCSINQDKNLQVLLHHHSHHHSTGTILRFSCTHTCICMRHTYASISGHLRTLRHPTFILFLVHHDSISSGMKTENVSIFLLFDSQAFMSLFYKIKFQLFSHHCKP